MFKSLLAPACKCNRFLPRAEKTLKVCCWRIHDTTAVWDDDDDGKSKWIFLWRVDGARESSECWNRKCGSLFLKAKVVIVSDVVS